MIHFCHLLEFAGNEFADSAATEMYYQEMSQRGLCAQDEPHLTDIQNNKLSFVKDSIQPLGSKVNLLSPLWSHTPGERARRHRAARVCQPLACSKRVHVLSVHKECWKQKPEGNT